MRGLKWETSYFPAIFEQRQVARNGERQQPVEQGHRGRVYQAHKKRMHDVNIGISGVQSTAGRKHDFRDVGIPIRVRNPCLSFRRVSKEENFELASKNTTTLHLEGLIIRKPWYRRLLSNRPSWARDMMKYVTKLVNVVPCLKYARLTLHIIPLDGVEFKSDGAVINVKANASRGSRVYLYILLEVFCLSYIEKWMISDSKL